MFSSIVESTKYEDIAGLFRHVNYLINSISFSLNLPSGTIDYP